MKNVTVIGLGVMGAALARGLLEQGFNVTVWNRTRAKARPLLDLGGKAPADLREGYMFGMIYGALLCEKSGVALEAYLELLPQLAPLLNDYLEVVRNSIPGGDFSNPPASLNTIGAAYHDALAPFRALDVSRELPELMARIVDASIEAGHGAEQMTAIIKTLR